MLYTGWFLTEILFYISGLNDKSYVQFLAKQTKMPEQYDPRDILNRPSDIHLSKNSMARNPISPHQLVGAENFLDVLTPNSASNESAQTKSERLKKAQQKKQEFEVMKRKCPDTSEHCHSLFAQ